MTLNEYAITPGEATNVVPLVSVEHLATDPHHDRILLVDVYLQQLSLWDYVRFHLQRHVQFIPGDELLAPGVSSGQLADQGYLEMSDSKESAEVAATRALGWPVPATATGAVVTEYLAHSPAVTAGLNVGDEVVSVNGVATPTACAMIRQTHSAAPGTVLHLRVARAHFSVDGVLTRSPVTSITLTTAAAPSDTADSGCPGVVGVARSWLGLGIEDGVTYGLPGAINVNTTQIGGPSAGLAMTLSIIDALSSGSLTGGHLVATTGTIDAAGNVGDVGGVAEKTIAVERAGASYFFVPQVEVATARANASPGLHVIGVTTLNQVLRDLRRIGGAAPVPLTSPTKP